MGNWFSRANLCSGRPGTLCWFGYWSLVCLDEAANGLGSNWLGIIQKIHLPLLKGPILVGSLLVFVDTIKELPITFILRPFDFDTLSVRIYQYAGDERIVEAILPAILITILGLIASSTLIPTLEKKN